MSYGNRKRKTWSSNYKFEPKPKTEHYKKLAAERLKFLETRKNFNINAVMTQLIVDKKEVNVSSKNEQKYNLNMLPTKKDISDRLAIIGSTYNDLDFDVQLLLKCISSDEYAGTIISGQAGSGKSHLLERFVNALEKGSKRVVVTSTTGISALNINGQTLHKALGLGLASESKEYYNKYIHAGLEKYENCLKWRERCPKKNIRIPSYAYKSLHAYHFLMNTDVLIIDEISMLPPTLFAKLNLLFTMFRQIDAPFGGVKIVMIGDFTQLPAIGQKDDNKIISKSGHIYKDVLSKSTPFLFDSNVFKSMNLFRIVLDRCYRQNEVGTYLKLLKEVRVGHISHENMELLQSRIGKTPDIKIGDCKFDPITVFPYRKQVNTQNQMYLDSISSPSTNPTKKYKGFLKVDPTRPDDDSKDTTDLIDEVSKKYNKRYLLDKIFPVVDIQMCVGAQVMMVANMYMDSGVSNGSIGKVIEFVENQIVVDFLSHDHSRVIRIHVDRQEFVIKESNDVLLTLTQYPLKLAWGLTIHKTQGLTLEYISLDLSKCFEIGQAYVALSRVSKLSDLYLIGFNPESIKYSPRAVEFETNF